MDRHDHSRDPSNHAPVEQLPPRRRLSDKISDAIAHAISQGRTRIAEHLSLIQDAVVEDEADVASERRADDELKKLADRYAKGNRPARPPRGHSDQPMGLRPRRGYDAGAFGRQCFQFGRSPAP